MGWLVSATARTFYPQEYSGAHCIGDWVSPRAGRVRKISLPPEIRSPERLVRKESLYRLRQPGPEADVCDG
jgi:hypothetical protein